MSGAEGTSWIQAWWTGAGFSPDVPGWMMALLGLVVTYCLVVLPSGAFFAYFSRKLGADLQARVGPNRAGPVGLLQPFADLLKLLQKDARREWTWREAIWLSVHTMALYSTVAVLPLGSLALMVDTDMSAFIPFWAALVFAFGTMLLGLSQGSVPGWFGGVRIAAQALAGAFPAIVALLCAGVRAGGFRWSQLASSQGTWPLGWTAFSNPFEFVAFLVFVMSGLVLLGIPPLDGGLSVQDLHGGVSSHLHGRRLSLFRLGRFYGFFFWSVITVVLFLGAWVLPAGVMDAIKATDDPRWQQVVELAWILFKTFGVMLAVVWVSRVNPRSRVDQITDFAWKVLSPFSLAALVGAGLWAGWRAL